MSILVMPRLGETVTEGTVVKWLKNEGDTIERDEMIVEISTDKVDTEIPSPATGTLEKILVPAGETCAVETELAVVAAPGEDRAKTGDDRAAQKERTVSNGPATPEAAPRTDMDARATSIGDGEAPGVVSPIVRKLARENAVDLSGVTGTGRDGRVTKKDIVAHIQAPAPSAPPAKVSAPRTAGDREEIVPLGHIRKVIAERMTHSLRTAAHVTAMIEVEMENIVSLRMKHKAEFKKSEGFSFTYLPFLCRAVVEALGRWPRLNASVAGEDLVIKKYVNLGIAVSIPNGLVVPVIKDAENLNILGLARAIHNLAARARSGSLVPNEVQGGTFTITNPGSFGSIMQTPIINPPEVGILSFDAIVKKPVVVDDAIAIRHVVNLSLSYDHRVNDGAVAAQFLRDLKIMLEAADFGDEMLD